MPGIDPRALYMLGYIVAGLLTAALFELGDDSPKKDDDEAGLASVVLFWPLFAVVMIFVFCFLALGKLAMWISDGLRWLCRKPERAESMEIGFRKPPLK